MSDEFDDPNSSIFKETMMLELAAEVGLLKSSVDPEDGLDIWYDDDTKPVYDAIRDHTLNRPDQVYAMLAGAPLEWVTALR